MKTAIDATGRVLIPKKVREQAAFPTGAALTARYLDGKIVLEPAPTEIRVEPEGAFTSQFLFPRSSQWMLRWWTRLSSRFAMSAARERAPARSRARLERRDRLGCNLARCS